MQHLCEIMVMNLKSSTGTSDFMSSNAIHVTNLVIIYVLLLIHMLVLCMKLHIVVIMITISMH